MSSFPVAPSHGLVLAALLFAVGLTGVLVRRNLIFVLFSLEIMLNSAGFAFVTAGAKWGTADGQIMFILILAVAAAEVVVALALLLRFHHLHKSLDANRATEMKG